MNNRNVLFKLEYKPSGVVHPANFSSPRTRANLRELAQTPSGFANGSPTSTPRELRRSSPGVRRPSSLELYREPANCSREYSFPRNILSLQVNDRSP